MHVNILKLFFYYWQQRLKEFETNLDGAPNDQTALEVSSEDNVYVFIRLDLFFLSICQ